MDGAPPFEDIIGSGYGSLGCDMEMTAQVVRMIVIYCHPADVIPLFLRFDFIIHRVQTLNCPPIHGERLIAYVFI